MGRGQRAAMTRLLPKNFAGSRVFCIDAAPTAARRVDPPAGDVADFPARVLVSRLRLASSSSPRSVIPDMSSTLPRVEGPADAELISAVRGGDVAAYGDLFERHVGAARRLARQLVSPSDADDLVSAAFAKVLAVLQRGGGPDVAFRAYLLTSVRRLHVDQIRAGARVQTTDDISCLRPGRAVPRHGRRGLRERRRGTRLRLAPRALAARAVAHRGRGSQAGRHRADAGDDRRTRSPHSPTAPARACARPS